MESEPHLYVVASDEDLMLEPDGFYKDGTPTEPFFDIGNVGKSPAIVTGLYRRWDVIPKGEAPQPVDKTALLPDGRYKPNYIPVGAGGRFPFIRGMIPGRLFKEPVSDRLLVWFYGFIEFRDLQDIPYISGFAMVFDEGRFHAAWPDKDAENYNYHRRVSGQTRQT